MTRNYLTYSPPRLPERKETRRDEGATLPPNCYRQKHIALVFGIPRVEIRRAIDCGLIDYEHYYDNARLVVRNDRLANFVRSYRRKHDSEKSRAEAREAREATDKFIIDLVSSGMTYPEIKRVSGYDWRRVKRTLQAHGVDTPTLSDAMRVLGKRRGGLQKKRE